MRAARLLVITATAFALAGCAGDGEDEAQPTAPPTATTAEQTTTATAPAELEGTPPTVDTLAGTWTRFGEALLFRLTRDGIFAYDRNNPDLPFAAGRYELEGRTITFVADGPGCRDTWTWDAAIEEAEDPLEDELRIVFTKPGCEVIAGTKWTFGRIASE